MSNDNALIVPPLPVEIAVDAAWLELRQSLLEQSDALQTVQNQLDFSAAEVLLKQLTGCSNALEKQRKAFARPFAEVEKQIKALADRERAGLEDAKSRIQRLMTSYLDEQQRQRREAEARAAEAERARLAVDPFGQPEAPAVLPGKVCRTMSSVREVWSFKIVNPALVPREFCSPDPAKIRACLADLPTDGATPEIAGIIVEKTTKIQAR